MTENTEVEIITPEAAEAILKPEVEKLITDGWRIIHESSFAARLVKERDMVDLQVDLLGQLERKQGVTLIYGPEIGRVIAWVLLLVSILLALALASALGFFK
ncbi:MAG: hypothetical protein HY862_02305 [Chloroflexi bacterium]|nr:hypothetical protein [Chloroflexota bacterium]